MNNSVPQDAAVWMEKGRFHLQRLDYAEALDCFRQALILTPSLSDGWLQYGSVLEKLGCYGAAIAANGNAQKLLTTPSLKLNPPLAEHNAALEAALALQQSNPDYWLKRGHALCDAGQYEAAIASYDKALSLKPDGEAWFGRGNMAAALGNFEEAILNYDQSVALQPDNYQAWNNRGYVLHRLSQYEAAIDSYDQAIALKPDCYPAWNNRGYALHHLERYEAALADFDRALAFEPNYPEAWNNRANALVALERYAEAVDNYDRAIALKPNFLEAQTARIQALQHLDPVLAPSATPVPLSSPLPSDIAPSPSTPEAAPQEVDAALLETLSQQLNQAIAHCQQQQFTEAESLIQAGLAQLEALLCQTTLSLAQRIDLEARFAGLWELDVDLQTQQYPTRALERSEHLKNRSLRPLQQDWHDTHPTYAQIQALLSARTAAICWHLSPVSLTTFMVRQGEPPQLLWDADFAQMARQRFTTWMQDWVQAHTPSGVTVPWQQTLEGQLFQQLAQILQIEHLCQTYLRGISQVILIPHREMHLLPLHALFPESFTLTYLPSAQMGLQLQQRSVKPFHRLLNIGKSPQPNADPAAMPLDALLLDSFYGPLRSLSISGTEANRSRVVAALNLMSDCLHFSGSVQQRVASPHQSGLALATSDWLTLDDILTLDLHRYGLVCLSACHFDLTDSDHKTYFSSLSLASAFLAAGADYVVSTLWRIDETARAILMLKFHEYLQQSFAPAIALAKAQKWLRTVSYQDLVSRYKTQSAKLLKHPAGQKGAQTLQNQILLLQQRAEELGATACPYVHPFYWAGFILTGCPPDTKLTEKLDTLSLQAFLEAISHIKEPFDPEFQGEFKRISARLRQLAQTHPILQHQYDAALKKFIKGDSTSHP